MPNFILRRRLEDSPDPSHRRYEFQQHTLDGTILHLIVWSGSSPDPAQRETITDALAALATSFEPAPT